MNFTIIDIVFVAFLLIMSIIGYKKGFISKLYDVISTIAVIIFSYLFAKPLSSVISLYPYDQENMIASLIGKTINQIVMFVVLLIVLFIIKKVLGIFLKPILKRIVGLLKATDMMNHVLGLSLSFIEGLIIGYLVLILIVIPLVPNGREWVDESLVCRTIVGISPQVSDIVENIDIDNTSSLSTEALLKTLMSADQMKLVDSQQFQTLFDENIKDEILKGNVSLSSLQKEELQDMLEKYHYNQQTIQEILGKINESDAK